MHKSCFVDEMYGVDECFKESVLSATFSLSGTRWNDNIRIGGVKDAGLFVFADEEEGLLRADYSAPQIHETIQTVTAKSAPHNSTCRYGVPALLADGLSAANRCVKRQL